MRTPLMCLGATAALLGAACGGGGSTADAPCAGPGTICTFAGSGVRGFDGDGQPAAHSALYWPMDLSFAPDGRAYVLDWQNHRVRRIEADGRFRTVMGSDLPGDGPPDQSDLQPQGAPGTKVELNHPTGVDFLPDGRVVVAAWHNHKIRVLDPATGVVRVLCGSGPGDSDDGVLASRALIHHPKSVAVDKRGRIFFADGYNQRLRTIDDDKLFIVAGQRPPAFAGDGGRPALAAFDMQQMNENPEPGGGIALDADGRIYLADTYNHRIRRIDLAADVVTTVAGNGMAAFAGDGGPATAASLRYPRDVEIGPDGRLYIADTDNHRIRAVDLTTGIITTVAGDGTPGFAGDGGAATRASLQRPFGVAFDAAGNLYVADTYNDRIRMVVR